jgi:hypothetical protein
MQQTTNNKQYLLMWIVDRRGSITNILILLHFDQRDIKVGPGKKERSPVP